MSDGARWFAWAVALARWGLDGRPMERIGFAFMDTVVHRPVYIWRDRRGRRWLAYGAWGWFRVACPDDGM